jgi:hypothetical protein
MKFERLESGEFLINGKLINRKAFLMLEPGYSEPVDTVYVKYESGVDAYRLIKTKTKQYKIIGEWIDGDRYIKRVNELKKLSSSIEQEINLEQKDITENINRIRNEKPILTYGDKRKLEYPSIEELVVAMWENLIEKKTKADSGVTELQKIRKEVKAKYPSEKPNALSQDETETN